MKVATVLNNYHQQQPTLRTNRKEPKLGRRLRRSVSAVLVDEWDYSGKKQYEDSHDWLKEFITSMSPDTAIQQVHHLFTQSSQQTGLVEKLIFDQF